MMERAPLRPLVLFGSQRSCISYHKVWPKPKALRSSSWVISCPTISGGASRPARRRQNRSSVTGPEKARNIPLGTRSSQSNATVSFTFRIVLWRSRASRAVLHFAFPGSFVPSSLKCSLNHFSLVLPVSDEVGSGSMISDCPRAPGDSTSLLDEPCLLLTLSWRISGSF